MITNPINSNHATKHSNHHQNNSNQRVLRNRHHRHHNEFPITASPQVQGYTKLMPTHNTSKLNTTILNHLNPQLTPEEKLSRTISHVEKWLTEDQSTTAAATIATALTSQTNNFPNKIHSTPFDSPSHQTTIANNLNKDDNLVNANNITGMDKLKITEKLSKRINETQSPRNVFNKELLLNKKSPKASLPHTNTCNLEKEHNIQKEYASIPIVVDPSQSECENLLRASSDESNSQFGGADTSLTTVHRYVHEHIHHHFHHFEPDD